MSVTKPFPATTVIGAYQDVEQMLRNVLKVVPYCDEHRSVWSPSLVTVLLEAGSQLDSLWRAECRLSRFTAPNPDVVEYHRCFAQYLEYRWVVFWGDEPEKIWPFDAWRGVSQFMRDTYRPLPWWGAYTKLKHDRLEHRKLATLENSVAAVAGLFLAIIRCKSCLDAIIQANWLSGLYHNPAAWLQERESTETYNQWITVETPLFTYPVGWCQREIKKGSNWDNEKASHRFRQWHEQHEQAAS